MARSAVAGQNAALTEMAMGYFRSRTLGAAARLGLFQRRADRDLAAGTHGDGSLPGFEAGLLNLDRVITGR